MRLVIVSGRSGSGKTIALHVLEDLGFYCIDNLPAGLLANIHEEVDDSHPNIAVSLDSRNLPQSDPENYDFKGLVSKLRAHYKSCDLIYLDADDQVLLKRFSENRRKHPLTSSTSTLSEAIKKEHKLLMPISNTANFMIDTTTLNQHELYKVIRTRVESRLEDSKNSRQQMQLLIQSFGFKHGLPDNADFVFDVRCLPNPYWQPELRSFTGLDSEVQDYLSKKTSIKKMLEDLTSFIHNWLPKFQGYERSYLTIAIGCTGGVHRSVYIAEQLSLMIKPLLDNIIVRHRELNKN